MVMRKVRNKMGVFYIFKRFLNRPIIVLTLGNKYYLIDHRLIHWSKFRIDSTSSCPLEVRRYSTLGGISLNAFLLKMPLFSNSLKRVERVLLKPFIDLLNVIYLTGSVVQHNGIRISSVPLFVINFLKSEVSFIKSSIL